MCLQTLSKSFRKHIDSLFALIFHVFIHSIIFIVFGWKSFIFFSVVPHLISGAIGAYLFYVQHNFPSVRFEIDENWTYEGAALESSSFLDTNRFMHWVTANIGYHHIHHLNSRIPFYRLPEIMSKVKELQSPKTTSLKVKDIFACLQLKVWDIEQNRMVGVIKK
jgi:omega-6 fatty acid desaturase (delta-12 desaturase)